MPPRQFFPSGNGRPVWQKVLCLAFVFVLNLASGGSTSEAEASKKVPEAIPEVDFKKLPKSILWDFTHGLFSADNLVPVLVGAGVAGVSTTFEDELTDRVRGEFEFLGDSGNVIGHPITATAGVVTALLASRFTDNRRFRAFSYTMAQSYVLENVMTLTIKAAVSRTRPNGANDNSFASGHTAATFSFATVAGHYFGKKVAIPAFAAGVWVGAARIESGKHFLSDVIIGAVVGIIAGRTAIRGTRTLFSEPHVQVVPQILGDSVGVTLHVRW